MIVNKQIEFENGAKVKCNFATNLIGDILVTTSRRLDELLDECASQPKKVNLPKYRYPEELLSVSDFQIMAKGNEDFYIRKSEAKIVTNLENHPKRSSGLFGGHILVSKAAAVKAAAVKAAAVKAAAVKAAAVKAIPITLSEREQAIVDAL